MKCDNLKRCFEPLNGDLSPNEIVDCNGLEKCEICGEESINNNLCLKCNQKKKLFLFKLLSSKRKGKIYRMYQCSTKTSNILFQRKK